MGADLYINSITDKAHEKYGPLFNAAVEERNELDSQIKAREQIVTIYLPMGSIPGWGKPLKVAEANLETTRVKLAEAQAKVSKYYDRMYPNAGYFRDSYNGTGVLGRLGLSWWQDSGGGVMTPEKLKGFLAKVKAKKLAPVTVAELKQNGCKVDADNTVKAWAKFYRNKKRRLIRFLERAVVRAEKGEKVYFSV